MRGGGAGGRGGTRLDHALSTSALSFATSALSLASCPSTNAKSRTVARASRALLLNSSSAARKTTTRTRSYSLSCVTILAERGTTPLIFPWSVEKDPNPSYSSRNSLSANLGTAQKMDVSFSEETTCSFFTYSVSDRWFSAPVPFLSHCASVLLMVL